MLVDRMSLITCAITHLKPFEDKILTFLTIQPFIPPPGAQAAYHQWTVGPVYYAALAMAEALGGSGTAQVIDLFPNNANAYTPAYGIYENGQMARVALFNYMTDSSGAHDYTATLNIGGTGSGEANATPSTVKVKYLRAASVAQKGNITWAGQVGRISMM